MRRRPPPPAKLDAHRRREARPSRGADIDDERKAIEAIRDYRVNLNGETLRIWRGEFHRHTELSPDGGGDGGLLDMWRYTLSTPSASTGSATATTTTATAANTPGGPPRRRVTLFTLPGRFVPMFSYERSVVYPEGHRNCMFARRGIRSLPRLPLSRRGQRQARPRHPAALPVPAPLQRRLRRRTPPPRAWAPTGATTTRPSSRSSRSTRATATTTSGPTPRARPSARRKLKKSTPEAESFGGYRPKGFVNLALLKGYRLAFESSSDHISTHLSFCNVLRDRADPRGHPRSDQEAPRLRRHRQHHRRRPLTRPATSSTSWARSSRPPRPRRSTST